MDVREASRRWGITDRRIRILCNEGRIDGAIKLGWSWTIPADTPKPRDGRILRHFKNLDIRQGFVDVDRLSALSEEFPVSSFRETKAFEEIIKSTLMYYLFIYNKNIAESQIDEVFSGRLCPELSLEDHLLILSFRSSMRALSFMKDEWTEKDIKNEYRVFMRSIDDNADGYRIGFSRNAVRGKDKVRVDVQMETLMTQYESWKALHPFISAVMLYGEMERIEPFSAYSSILSYLLMAGEMMKGGILPPVFSVDLWEELRGSAFIAYSRGNYRDLTSFLEKRTYESYEMVRRELEK